MRFIFISAKSILSMPGRRISEMPLLDSINYNTVVLPVCEIGVSGSPDRFVARTDIKNLVKVINDAKLKAKANGDYIVFVPENEADGESKD